MEGSTKAELLNVTPVLPSSDIARDIAWYKDRVGFQCMHEDGMYAVLRREMVWMHLQWHADTEDDPLLGGSVVKIFVKNARSLFNEFVERGIVDEGRFRSNTAWGTHEFGFYDLNKNAIFFVEDIV